MSCQFGMLKGAALGQMSGGESVACVQWAFRGICLLCLLKIYTLCLLTAMLSLRCLHCDLAGLVNPHVGSKCAGHVRSAGWGRACATAVGPAGGRLVPGVTWRGSVARAMGLHYLKSEGKGCEVTGSMKQVDYKEE